MSGIDDPFATGVLDKDVHAKLVANIDAFSQVAGIQPDWLWTPLHDTVSPAEVTWVRRFKHHTPEKKTGLILAGPSFTDATTHMSALTGALLRNFINARLASASTVLDWLDDGEFPDITCLLIPNFFLGKAMKAELPAWKVLLLQELLMERHLAGKQTVVYVSDKTAMAAEFGPAVAQLLTAYYETIVLK